MSARAALSLAEIEVMEAVLPSGLTDDTRDVGLCLFEGIVLMDVRAGTAQPDAPWLAQLQIWSRQALAQLVHLSSERGGRQFYLSKSVDQTVALSARNREMCERHRGDVDATAAAYGLTPVRVRQILNQWQRERYLGRQAALDLS